MNQDASHKDNLIGVAERIAYLIAGFLQKKLTEAEHDELDAWITASDDNLRLFEELTDENNIEAAILWHQQLDQQKAFNNIKKQVGLRGKTRSLFRSFWLYGVTACLVVLAAGAYWIYKAKETPSAVSLAHPPLPLIHPGIRQAVLTLENGRTIILDSTASGLLTRQGAVQVEKSPGGLLTYKGKDSLSHVNTLSIPRGGYYALALSDGTRVWLNAESSLTFPASFTGAQREVSLQGEGYFEVARDPSRPFLVHVRTPSGDGGTVRVLGTHFNINAYEDETLVKTTLLEGSVRIEKAGLQQTLKPGQQAQVGTGIRVLTVNVQKAIAWKEGLFLFQDASTADIAGQLSRWYDIDVEQQGKIPFHFTATIKRQEPLAEVLQVLQATGRIHFHLEGKKLTIQP